MFMVYQQIYGMCFTSKLRGRKQTHRTILCFDWIYLTELEFFLFLAKFGNDDLRLAPIVLKVEFAVFPEKEIDDCPISSLVLQV
jgi:hypothetical protein